MEEAHNQRLLKEMPTPLAGGHDDSSLPGEGEGRRKKLFAGTGYAGVTPATGAMSRSSDKDDHFSVIHPQTLRPPRSLQERQAFSMLHPNLFPPSTVPPCVPNLPLSLPLRTSTKPVYLTKRKETRETNRLRERRPRIARPWRWRMQRRLSDEFGRRKRHWSGRNLPDEAR